MTNLYSHSSNYPIQVQVDKNCNATVATQNQMNATPSLPAQTNQNLSQSQNINAQLSKPAPDSAPIKGVTTTAPVGKVSCNNKLFLCYLLILFIIFIYKPGNKSSHLQSLLPLYSIKKIYYCFAFHHLTI